MNGKRYNMSKLLIVIDMQNDFISGSLGRKAAEVIVPAVVNKVNKYFENKDSVIYTQDTHDKNYFNTLEGKNSLLSTVLMKQKDGILIAELCPRLMKQ